MGADEPVERLVGDTEIGQSVGHQLLHVDCRFSDQAALDIDMRLALYFGSNERKGMANAAGNRLVQRLRMVAVDLKADPAAKPGSKPANSPGGKWISEVSTKGATRSKAQVKSTLAAWASVGVKSALAARARQRGREMAMDKVLSRDDGGA